MRQMARHGLGKLIKANGSFSEGTWDNDKLHGKACRLFEAETGNMYAGNIEENKKSGQGK